MELTRRGVLCAGLTLGVAGGLAGCSASSSGSSTSSSVSSSSTTTSAAPSSSASSPTASSSPTAATELPAVTSWSPDGNDLQAACKQAATRHVEAAGNGNDRAMQVIFAQYGGLLTDSASVLVVTRSWVLSGNQVRTGGRTFDVRLSRHGATWRVDQVNPSAPGARAGSLSATARRVLTSDRIDLPPDARADVASGQVHDSVLAAMLTLAADYRLGISVVRSGHPTYVFGTDRLSDHPQGRAFDTWRIDGHPVVDARTSKSLVTEYMQAAAAAGSYNVGGPYLLGSAPQWFSDNTHHDHVHAGFTT